MVRSFFVLGAIPELRPEAPSVDRAIPAVEISIEIDKYWELVDMIKEMRRRRLSGLSSHVLLKNIYSTIMVSIMAERERIWFKANFNDIMSLN